ncbi:MAG: hypothetical protein ACYC6B_06365 [Thermoleophilia bacterium]
MLKGQVLAKLTKELILVAILAILAIVIGMASVNGSIASAASSSSTPAGVTPPATPKSYYFSWYDSTAANGMTGDWIVIGNLEDSGSHVEVYFGNETTPRATYDIPARGRETLQWLNTIGGPVRVVSTDGAALVVTQRVLYQDSFNEVAAIEEGNLGASLGGSGKNDYYFTWYDSRPENGMKGNWIIISNPDPQDASVDVYIGDDPNGNHYDVASGERVTPQYPDTIGGPVHVVSQNGQRLVVSQRVLYQDSFNEVTAMPGDQLDSFYYFTWYDMIRRTGMKGNWIVMSNINDDITVHAQVYIGTGGTPKGTYAIGPHQSVTPTYPELMDGPVRVICTDCASGQNILVSQRILFKDSFEEVQGTPTAGLSDQQFLGWYDFKASNQMAGNWLLIANQGAGNAAVDVYLGSSTEPIGTYQIAEGDRVTPQFPELMDGPVRVVSRGHQPLMVSQRVLYKDSFNELLGLTETGVGMPLTVDPEMTLFKLNTYWASYTDYENHKLSVLMRMADTGQGTAVGTTITEITTNNGVTVLTPRPIDLGDIASSAHADFVVTYDVPPSVTVFNTSVHGSCQDTGGAWFYYP